MIVRDQPSIFRVLFSWRGTILPKVLPPLGVVMLISAVIGGLSYIGYFHFPEFPLVGFTLIGVVLSIFLGFKNTACYDRWWGARKLWGMLIANARHFDRDCRMLTQGRRERVVQHVIVFANVLRDRLRHQTANPLALVETSGMSQQALTQLYQQYQFPTLINVDAQHGLGTSIAAGIQASQAANGWLIALADMPFIQPATLRTLWQALNQGAALVAPYYQGQRGHPVGVSAAFKADLLALNQDHGAQRLLQQQQALLQLIQTQDAGVVWDIDTPSDLPRGQTPPVTKARPYSEVLL